ncbi:MAG: stage II sporulation protein M, partial [Candidatus Aenigmatarchaeota archaeon]
MVLESIFPAKKIENKPVDMILLSTIVSFVSVFAASWIYPSGAGIISPMLVTIAMTPVVYRILMHEEEIEAAEAEKKIDMNFWQRHGEVVWLFALFFIGNFISIFFISLVFPQQFVEQAFAQQLADIAAVSAISGAAITGTSLLKPIIENNLRVMLFAFALSFLFATGALFILSWNASILALFLAGFLRQGLYSEFATTTAGIMPHVPIEMLAYFLAGIAGGMLSAGVIREKFMSPE